VAIKQSCITGQEMWSRTSRLRTGVSATFRQQQTLQTVTIQFYSPQTVTGHAYFGKSCNYRTLLI
jgi:hypothetical protein